MPAPYAASTVASARSSGTISEEVAERRAAEAQHAHLDVARSEATLGKRGQGPRHRSFSMVLSPSARSHAPARATASHAGWDEGERFEKAVRHVGVAVDRESHAGRRRASAANASFSSASASCPAITMCVGGRPWRSARKGDARGSVRSLGP